VLLQAVCAEWATVAWAVHAEWAAVGCVYRVGCTEQTVLCCGLWAVLCCAVGCVYRAGCGAVGSVFVQSVLLWAMNVYRVLEVSLVWREAQWAACLQIGLLCAEEGRVCT
jgi:hypothetical protein